MRSVLFVALMMMVVPSAFAFEAELPPELIDALPVLPPEDETIPDISNWWIVGFHEMIDTSSGRYGLWEIVDHSEELAFVTVVVPEVATFEAWTMADENVKYVEQEQWHTLMYTPSDPWWNTNDYSWGFKQIRAQYAWDRTRGTTSAKVCVLDTGLYKSHQEFSGLSRILGGWDAVYEDSNPNDPNGHGTHVTGIIGGKINAYGVPGMAQSNIYPVRVLNAQGSGTTTDIAQGYDRCRSSGSHIASASLGGGSSSTISNAVANYRNANGLPIAAAGNSGCGCISYPAGYSGVIGVGASDKSNARASFSQWGSHVDLVAPGVRIVSAYISSTSSYAYMDGTSMATPFVSGVAALVKSRYPTWSASQIGARLTGTAQDLGASGWDQYTGYGLVRADSATV